MERDTTPSFTVELHLKTSQEDEKGIDKSLDAGRMIFTRALAKHSDALISCASLRVENSLTNVLIFFCFIS